MPGIGPDYAKTWNTIGPYAMYGLSGTDPSWTDAAMALGFRPNMFAPVGQEGVQEQRFLATLANIMGQAMGGPNGAAARNYPNNPSAGTSFGVQQYLDAAMGLMRSPYTQLQLMPGDQMGMYDQGWTFNPITPGSSLSGSQQYARDRRMGFPSESPGGNNPSFQNGTAVTPVPGQPGVANGVGPQPGAAAPAAETQNASAPQLNAAANAASTPNPGVTGNENANALMVAGLAGQGRNTGNVAGSRDTITQAVSKAVNDYQQSNGRQGVPIGNYPNALVGLIAERVADYLTNTRR